MRIVIDTDQPAEDGPVARPAAARLDPEVSDGGPAPTEVLRQFIRVPSMEPGLEGVEDIDGGAPDLNPLRRGEALAAELRGQAGHHREDPQVSVEDDIDGFGARPLGKDGEAD